MGMLIDGQWSQKDIALTNGKGEYERVVSSFRDVISATDEQFTPEPDRYHLFANAGCPWAYRALLYRSIKGLEDDISLSLTEPAAGKEGWTFGAEPEPLLGAKHIHDVYRAADSNFTGRCTVPVLWDKKLNTIVNNESADIIRMLNSAFSQISPQAPNYYPEQYAEQIDAWNAEIYQYVNNGVYRCGFARSQHAYEQAYKLLFQTLDKIDAHLGDHRYLCGDEVTEADWRLFSTLVRFDLAYYSQFRCNQQRIVDYENLWPYSRDLYQQPGVAKTVDMAAIKGIYFGSRPPRIIPVGPQLNFSAPHHR